MEETDEWMDEEIEEEPIKAGVAIDTIEKDDWLAVVHNGHWWLAKCIDVDTEQQDVKV